MDLFSNMFTYTNLRINEIECIYNYSIDSYGLYHIKYHLFKYLNGY
jgi:hypothetical protein